jgi:hypothetical protein
MYPLLYGQVIAFYCIENAPKFFPCAVKCHLDTYLRVNVNESQLPRSQKINGTARPKTTAEKRHFRSG